tara:strand:- start:2774 stop:3976 length:1203 start_codon:yes stop_codon:yes gene_type:complete
MKHKLYQSHSLIAIVYFLVAALLGVLLRSYPTFSFNLNYRFVVHAHSHIALLGWAYVALTTLLHYCFTDKDTASISYKRVFWCTQGTLIGMLFTFPFQGYALFSIIFSTLFLIMSYVFFHHFLKSIDPQYRHSRSLLCIKAALWYMVISSVGPWALGAIMNSVGAQSIWYRLAIYFYLHFQYNGWMILALTGLFLFALEQNGMVVPQKKFKYFFWLLNIGVVLTFFLSVLWTQPSTLIYMIAGIGAVVQLYAFVLLGTISKNGVVRLSLSKMQYLLLGTVVMLGLAKMALQLLISLPYFANMATIYLDLTIGYLHMTFLGVISIGRFFLMSLFGLLRLTGKAYLGYFSGFLITEFLIFYKGLAAWQEVRIFEGHAKLLAMASLLIPIGILAMYLHNRVPK